MDSNTSPNNHYTALIVPDIKYAPSLAHLTNTSAWPARAMSLIVLSASLLVHYLAFRGARHLLQASKQRHHAASAELDVRIAAAVRQALAADLGRLDAETNDHKADIDGLKTGVRQLLGEKDVVKAEVEELAKRISQVEDDAQKKLEKSLEDVKQHHDERVNSLALRNNSAAERAERAEAEDISINGRIGKLARQQAVNDEAVSARVATTEQKFREQVESLDSLTKVQATSLEGELQGVRCQTSENAAAIKDITKTVDKLQKDLSVLSNHVHTSTATRKEVAEILTKIQNVESSVSALDEKSSKAVVKLQKEVENLNEHVTDLQRDDAKHRKAIDEARTLFDNVSRDLSIRVANIEQRTGTVKEGLDSLRTIVDQVQRTLYSNGPENIIRQLERADAGLQEQLTQLSNCVAHNARVSSNFQGIVQQASVPAQPQPQPPASVQARAPAPALAPAPAPVPNAYQAQPPRRQDRYATALQQALETRQQNRSENELYGSLAAQLGRNARPRG